MRAATMSFALWLKQALAQTQEQNAKLTLCSPMVRKPVRGSGIRSIEHATEATADPKHEYSAIAMRWLQH